MGSRIVQLRGSWHERRSIHEAVGHGMYMLASVNSTYFFHRRISCENYHDADRIAIDGKLRTFDYRPNDTPDRYIGTGYRSADFIVVLERPDTKLYHLCRSINTHPAEAGQAHSILLIAAIGFGFVATLLVSLVFGQEWWSFIWAVIMALAIVVAFLVEYPIRVMYAAWCARRYVMKAIRNRRGTPEHYRELVVHLADCSERVVSDVYKQVLKRF